MDNTGEMLEKLKNLNDTELEAAIRNVAKALGANDRMAAKLASERSKIRRKLDGASESDLRKAMSHLNKNQIENVISNLGLDSGGGNGSK